MRRSAYLILVVFTAVFLYGCASTGGIHGIEKGTTTKEDLKHMLGEPDSRDFDSSKEVWTYNFLRERKAAGAAKILKLKVVIEDAKVESYEAMLVEGIYNGPGDPADTRDSRPLRPLPPRPFLPPPFR